MQLVAGGKLRLQLVGMHLGSLSGMNNLLSSTISKATQYHKKIDSLFRKNDTTKVKLGSLLSISFCSKIPMLIFVVAGCRCLRGALATSIHQSGNP